MIQWDTQWSGIHNVPDKVEPLKLGSFPVPHREATI